MSVEKFVINLSLSVYDANYGPSRMHHSVDRRIEVESFADLGKLIVKLDDLYDKLTAELPLELCRKFNSPNSPHWCDLPKDHEGRHHCNADGFEFD